MAWNDDRELVVAAGGQVYVAPVGTPLPELPDERLNAAFEGTGYITEDGAALTVSPEIAEHRAWQARSPIRRDITAQEIQAAFGLQQWNEVTVPLAFGGGRISEPRPGVFRYDFLSDEDVLDERAMVIDAIDGTTILRFVFPRGNVTEAVETSFQRERAAILPITFRALEPEEGVGAGYFLSNAVGFAVGS